MWQADQGEIFIQFTQQPEEIDLRYFERKPCKTWNEKEENKDPQRARQDFIKWSRKRRETNSSKFQNLEDEDDSENAKLQFLYDKVEARESFNMKLAWQTICQLAEYQHQMFHELLRMDPTAGIRSYTGATDVIASFAGDVLVVQHCDQVRTKTIYWTGKVRNKCYNRLPVLLEDDTLWFVIPGTTDLVRDGEETDCDHQMQLIYQQNNGKWFSGKGEVHVEVLTHLFNQRTTKSEFIFDAPAVMSNQYTGLATSRSFAVLCIEYSTNE